MRSWRGNWRPGKALPSERKLGIARDVFILFPSRGATDRQGGNDKCARGYAYKPYGRLPWTHTSRSTVTRFFRGLLLPSFFELCYRWLRFLLCVRGGNFLRQDCGNIANLELLYECSCLNAGGRGEGDVRCQY